MSSLANLTHCHLLCNIAFAHGPTILKLVALFFFIVIVNGLLMFAFFIIVILDEIIKIVLTNFIKVKVLFNGHSEIIQVVIVNQKLFKKHKLFVVYILFERNNWNSITELYTKTVDSIINQKHVF